MSTHRFDHKVDRRFKTEASRGARVEVITGVERRRDWTDEEKLAIVAESCEDGVVISDVARRHGLRPQQLFTWRNEFRRREAARLQCGGAPAFTPVMIAHDRPAGAAAEAPAVAAPVSSAGAAQIEIVLGGAIVRLHGAADAKILAAVLRAVKAAT
jgi:transposase